MLGKKEKQNKNNLQLKFYTWLGIEPDLPKPSDPQSCAFSIGPQG